MGDVDVKAKIINLDAEEVDLVLVDTEINVNGQPLYFKSTGDKSSDQRALDCINRQLPTDPVQF